MQTITELANRTIRQEGDAISAQSFVFRKQCVTARAYASAFKRGDWNAASQHNARFAKWQSVAFLLNQRHLPEGSG